MEIILSVLFIIGFILFVRAQEINAFHKIDCEKVNNDKFMNDLSQSQVNYNIMSENMIRNKKTKRHLKVGVFCVVCLKY